VKSTEIGSTGRHYLVFKDQKKIADLIYLCSTLAGGAANRLV
jgi:hypothetical protein